MNKDSVYLCTSVVIALSVVLLLQSFETQANAADREWRFNEHGRNIDIDICVMCTQPGPPGPQGEQGPPGPPAESRTGTISVIVEILCMGNVALVPCEPFPVPSPSDFIIQVLAGNPTEPIQGSTQGTPTTIESGSYEVIILNAPDPTPQSSQPPNLDGIVFSDDCIGSITVDETKICTITSTYDVVGLVSRTINVRPNVDTES